MRIPTSKIKHIKWWDRSVYLCKEIYEDVWNDVNALCVRSWGREFTLKHASFSKVTILVMFDRLRCIEASCSGLTQKTTRRRKMVGLGRTRHQLASGPWRCRQWGNQLSCMHMQRIQLDRLRACGILDQDYEGDPTCQANTTNKQIDAITTQTAEPHAPCTHWY
jgi:hypothetical protein